MDHKNPVRAALLALGVATVLAAQAAHADVTVQRQMSVEGAGAMSVIDMSGTTTTAISGQRERTDSNLQMKSRLVRMFAHGAGHTSEIIRLDQGQVYQLDPDKKQYSEISLADQRAQLEQAAQKSRQAQQKQPSPTGMDESQCQWSQPVVDVKQTGSKATIAGYAAQQTTVTSTQSCTDAKTGSVCKVVLTLDEWLAPDVEGTEEFTKFQQAYAQKVGLGAGGTATQRAAALFSRYPGAWKQVADKMNALHGYPVRMSFALGFGGPQCKSAQQAQSSQASLPQASPPSGATMSSEIATSAGEAAGETLAEKAGASAFGGLAGEIGGRFASRLFHHHHKKKKVPPQPAADAQSATVGPGVANGLITPLRITSELVSVKQDPIAADTFEVPADYRKVAHVR